MFVYAFLNSFADKIISSSIWLTTPENSSSLDLCARCVYIIFELVLMVMVAAEVKCAGVLR